MRFWQSLARAGSAAVTGRRLRAPILGTVALMGFACAGAPPPPSRLEDKARLDVPIAICRKPLSPGDLGDGGAPGPDAYFSVVFPSFRSFGAPLGAHDPDCVGETHGSGVQGTPGPIAAADAIIVPGEDVDVVWLRAFQPSADRTSEGPLALVRARPSEIDVYAVGDYHGSPSHSRFTLAKLGSTRAVVAADDGCADVKVGAECESTLTLYVVIGGKLAPAATSPAERIRYGTKRNLGRLQYRLTTDPPVFDKATMTVHEKLQVRDSGEEDIRKAEGDRVFVLGADGRVAAQQDSLWSQVPQ
ncbi:MAG TPA: hypothetical protein VEK07_19055 [Polyangiaceae bacterium]|nr:hypothetical protein [Polyangiaceae bacterium]